jgi:predicted Ser/Thr protein kinase
VSSEEQPCLELERLVEISQGAAASFREMTHFSRCEECRRQLDELREEESQLSRLVYTEPSGRGDFGPYHILRMLGEGGMSKVYACRGEEGGEWAVKVCQDPALLHYFAAEARLLELCRSHSVPSVLPLVSADLDHLPAYLVLPVCAGGSLGRRIAQGGALSTEEVWRLAQRLGAAIAGMHQAGIVHGDLKPDNVLLDDQGDCWIADLGTARQIQIQRGEEEARRTGTRPAALTAAYMAPEQACGTKGSQASDIYAYGLILYQAATGQHPFGVGTDWEIVSRMLASPGPDPKPLRQALPPRFAEFIQQCLQVDPGRRPGSALLAHLSRSLLRPLPSWRRLHLRPVLAVVLAAVLFGFWADAELRRREKALDQAAHDQGEGALVREAEPPLSLSKDADGQGNLTWYGNRIKGKELEAAAELWGMKRRGLKMMRFSIGTKPVFQVLKQGDHCLIIEFRDETWQRRSEFHSPDELRAHCHPNSAEFFLRRSNGDFLLPPGEVKLENLQPYLVPPGDIDVKLFP